MERERKRERDREIDMERERERKKERERERERDREDVKERTSVNIYHVPFMGKKMVNLPYHRKVYTQYEVVFLQ
jgi:hypothetical protein